MLLHELIMSSMLPYGVTTPKCVKMSHHSRDDYLSVNHFRIRPWQSVYWIVWYLFKRYDKAKTTRLEYYYANAWLFCLHLRWTKLSPCAIWGLVLWVYLILRNQGQMLLMLSTLPQIWTLQLGSPQVYIIPTKLHDCSLYEGPLTSFGSCSVQNGTLMQVSS